MIERGHKEYPYLDLRVKSDASIAFPDQSFDAVILFAVLTCIIKDEKQQELIKEIHRVLKPDGSFMSMTSFLIQIREIETVTKHIKTSMVPMESLNCRRVPYSAINQKTGFTSSCQISVPRNSPISPLGS